MRKLRIVAVLATLAVLSIAVLALAGGVAVGQRAAFTAYVPIIMKQSPTITTDDLSSVTISAHITDPVSGTAGLGDMVTFRVEISNTGDSPIIRLPLDDLFDARYLEFASAIPAPNTAIAGLLTWDNLNGGGPSGFGRSLMPGEGFTLDITFRAIGCPRDGITTHKVEIVGAIDSLQRPVPRLGVTVGVSINCESPSSVRVQKLIRTPASGVINDGDLVTLDLVLTNQGITAIRFLPLHDLYDPHFLEFSSATPTPNSVVFDSVTWTDLTASAPNGFGSNLAPGETVTVSLTLRAIGCPTTMGTNDLAEVVGAIDDNNQPVPRADAWATVTVACAGATLTKTRVGPERRAQEETISFDITIQNTGNAPVTGLPLVDTFDPAVLTFVSASITPNSTAPAGTLTWADLTGPAPNGFGRDLMPGESFTVRVTYVATGCPTGTTTTETARVEGAIVTGPGGPAILPAMTATASVDIACPDIRVQKFLVPPAAGAITLGETARYNIRITNQGNRIVRRLPLIELFDVKYMAFDSAFPPPSSVVDGHAQWLDLTLPVAEGGFGRDLMPGDVVTVTMTLRAVGCPPQQETTDLAEVTDAIDEELNPVPATASTATVKIACPAVTVTKQAVEPECGLFGIGQPVPFTIIITNTGNSVLNVVPLQDTFDPAYLAFVSATLPPDQAPMPSGGNGTLIWNNLAGPPPHGAGTSLAPGASFMLNATFTALASTSYQHPPLTTDTVTVAGATDEYGFTAETQTASETVAIADADLFIEKTGPAEAVAGSIVTWTVRYRNLGPDDAVHVRIRDIIPPAVNYVSDSLCGEVNTVGCFIHRLGAGEFGSFQVSASIPMTTTPGLTFTNEVQIASGFTSEGPICGIPDRNAANNISRTTVLVVADFGDAPDPPYATLLAHNGAFHRDFTKEWLGATVDGEPDARFPDLDDDGVVFPNWDPPPPYRYPGLFHFIVKISTSGLGEQRYAPDPEHQLYLRVWVDWNKNGIWEPGELVTDWTGGPGLQGTDGVLWQAGMATNTIRFDPPIPRPAGSTWVRMRLSYGAPAGPTGPTDYGEVEDYEVRFTSAGE